MSFLIGLSAFFSASEAALFSLRTEQLDSMAEGTRKERYTIELLTQPERLLSTILFYNLAINVLYFSISSTISLKLGQAGSWEAGEILLFSIASLVVIVFFSEMLPKSLAVVFARPLSGLVSLPLGFSVLLLWPILPTFQYVSEMSRRLFWPNFEKEPHLEIADLERAIEISTSDKQLVEQEQLILRNIVLLSEISLEEAMRPRNQLDLYTAPVSLAQLQEKSPTTDYILIVEPTTETITEAITLISKSYLPKEHLNQYAKPVLYLPWCATVAEAWQQARKEKIEVIVVVNEFGESIGILPQHDILHMLFSSTPSRSQRLQKQLSIKKINVNTWQATGMTSIRRVERYFGMTFSKGKSNTLAGILQEKLGRIPEVGDHCRWGGFEISVIEISDNGQMLVHLKRSKWNR